jgi:hypothetical protein
MERRHGTAGRNEDRWHADDGASVRWFVSLTMTLVF